MAVPYFWKHKYAPLAFCVPALVTLCGLYQSYELHSAARAQIKQMSNMFGGDASQMMGSASDMVPIGLGLGAYVCIAVAAYLAYRGVMRHLRSESGTSVYDPAIESKLCRPVARPRFVGVRKTERSRKWGQTCRISGGW
jgi:hypothetical protein